MHTYELKDYLNPIENINIIYMPADKNCPVHVHEFAELIFASEGTATHYVDDRRYDMAAGDLLFVNFGQRHSFEVGEEYQYYNLLYVPEFFSSELIDSENIYDIFRISLFREFETQSVKDAQMVHFRGEEYLELRKLIEDMRKEFERKEIGYRGVLTGYSRVLFSKLLRRLPAAKVETEMQKCINRLTAEVLSYIDSRCFEKVSLREIAEQTFYNPSYLSRLFKTQYGLSLSDYIKEKRMEEAARLLQEGALSNEEIMNRVGYTDKKQFYRNFREVYHLTPAEYRKKILH